MKYCTAIGLLVLAISVGYVYQQFRAFVAPDPMPDVDLHAFWGPIGSEANYRVNNETVLQQIRYHTEPIERIRQQLNETFLLQPPLAGANFTYGFNTDFVRTFVEYWRDEYLRYWPSREVQFNRMPHFKTNVQGLDLHYIHTKATYDVKNKTIIPLLLIHGWPGSVREFYDFITLLATPDRDDLDIVFEVVAPSLPGFGWSAPAQRSGMGVGQMAVVLRNLMARLGYGRYYVQGGDWGSGIGAALATLFPDEVIGYHSNMCVVHSPLALLKHAVANFAPQWFVPREAVEFHFPLGVKLVESILESGYMHLQSSKPDTIGTALSMHPLALGVYMFEKYSTWTNAAHRNTPDGGWSQMSEEYRNAILDNIMIYQLTRTITTSSRLYAEHFSAGQLGRPLDKVQTNVPTGCARFRHDIIVAMDWQLQDKFTNIVHSTYHAEGGHFIAMENPELLFVDFAQFVKTVEKLRPDRK